MKVQIFNMLTYNCIQVYPQYFTISLVFALIFGYFTTLQQRFDRSLPIDYFHYTTPIGAKILLDRVIGSQICLDRAVRG
jgi:hypothetical protein